MIFLSERYSQEKYLKLFIRRKTSELRGENIMLDAETLRDLLVHLSQEDRRECIDELARLEISEKNADQVYNILKVLETGLDVNMAIQVRAICRKIEAQFPGKFSFEFLTSQPAIKHILQPETSSINSVDTSNGFKICPFCTETIAPDSKECQFCKSSFEDHVCQNCGRHSYESMFCIWCDSLMKDPAWQKPPLTKRALAALIDAAVFALPLFFSEQYARHLPAYQIALLATTFYTLFVLTGSSPGKRATGLFVLNSTKGSHAGTLQILFREFPCRLLSLMLLGLGFFWGLFDENGQTWHDILAKSVVVKKTDQT